jgi:3-methyladenine DNA glycosylase/8-oxoguanine DNA glycosylase
MRRICGRSDYRGGSLRAIAEAVHSGTLDFDRSRELGDEEAVAKLVLIKGVVRWIAEAYLSGL